MTVIVGIAVVIGALLLVVVLLGAVFLIGMRTKSPRVLDAVRGMNRRFFNPKQMKSAGTPGAYASVIQHRGRSTGQIYDTPIGAVETDDGFVIVLPYGTRSNWVKNVLASGSATLVHEGQTSEVDRPELVPAASVDAYFSAGEQRVQRLFGVRDALRLRRSGD